MVVAGGELIHGVSWIFEQFTPIVEHLETHFPVERLGTPIRAVLVRLEQEGLLYALFNGGYAVKTFSQQDVSRRLCCAARSSNINCYANNSFPCN